MMPVKKICVSFDADLLGMIEDYRAGNNLPTQTEAVRALVRAGLERKPASPARGNRAALALLAARTMEASPSFNRFADAATPAELAALLWDAAGAMEGQTGAPDPQRALACALRKARRRGPDKGRDDALDLLAAMDDAVVARALDDGVQFDWASAMEEYRSRREAAQDTFDASFLEARACLLHLLDEMGVRGVKDVEKYFQSGSWRWKAGAGWQRCKWGSGFSALAGASGEGPLKPPDFMENL